MRRYDTTKDYKLVIIYRMFSRIRAEYGDIETVETLEQGVKYVQS